MAGKHGKAAHERLVNRIRFRAPHLVAGYSTNQVFVMADEGMMVTFLREDAGDRWPRDAGYRIPDVLFVGPEGPVIVEVGNLQADKWPEYPVVHVGFDGHTTVINDTGADFVRDVKGAIDGALAARG